jgi:hypothetical protein
LTSKKSSLNGDTSFSSVASASPHQKYLASDGAARAIYDSKQPIPTVLELGRMKAGAVKSRQPSTSVQNIKRVTEDDNDDGHEDRVRDKLLHARCLKAAREFGLTKKTACLRSFSRFAGMQNFAIEVVRSMSVSAGDHHKERLSSFTEKLKPFCARFDIDYDEALLEYTKQLCGSTNASASTIKESASGQFLSWLNSVCICRSFRSDLNLFGPFSVAQCCTNEPKKCQCILIVLRAALFCGYFPPWLSELATEAVEWSSFDIFLRSEIVEAGRLLLVDSLVRSYLGSKACELFRVDNPRHAIRLLGFVAQHFRRESVLNDVLDLADAFNHLSPLDACTLLFYNAIVGGCTENCSDFCEKLYERDSLLADSTCARVVSYCSELVAECSKAIDMKMPPSRLDRAKKDALNASSVACSIIPIAFAQSHSIASESLSMNPYKKVDFSLLESLKLDFLRINELQRDHSVFLSISDLKCPKKVLHVAASLLEPVVMAYNSEDRTNGWTLQLTRTRRACSLLAAACDCQEMEFWCAAVAIVTSPLEWKYDDGRCIDFLGDLGVLGGFRASNAVSSRAILSVAFCLCIKASNESRSSQNGFLENFGRAVSLLKDYCLILCPKSLLNQSQSLFVLAESVWQVLLRGDEGVGETLEGFRKKLLEEAWNLRNPFTRDVLAKDDGRHEIRDSLCRPVLNESWYIGDGLLLPPAESITRTVKFCKELMSSLTVSSHNFVPITTGGISEVTRFLLSRGALSVSLRLLSCSSVMLLCSRVPGITYGTLTSAIHDVFTASAERSLGGSGNGITSRIVDSQLAVSFLLSLPIKLAFKVRKSSLK